MTRGEGIERDAILHLRECCRLSEAAVLELRKDFGTRKEKKGWDAA
jgi:hypothetical protein